jgi:putative membrane protein
MREAEQGTCQPSFDSTSAGMCRAAPPRKMNRKILSCLTLISALSLAGACSSDDDDDDNVGGRAGTSQGGRTNGGGGANQGGRAGGMSMAGEPSDGGFPSGGAGASQGGAAAGDAGSAGSAGAGGAGGTGPIGALSDAQILLVLDTLNQGEVEEAYAVLPRLADADVKAFAQDMVTDHGAARQSVSATAEVLGEAPTPSETQSSLKSEAEANVAALRATPTNSLDAMYIELQVSAHAEALTLLDELTAAADAEELTTLLAMLKTAVQQHYERAQELQAAL